MTRLQQVNTFTSKSKPDFEAKHKRLIPHSVSVNVLIPSIFRYSLAFTFRGLALRTQGNETLQVPCRSASPAFSCLGGHRRPAPSKSTEIQKELRAAHWTLRGSRSRLSNPENQCQNPERLTLNPKIQLEAMPFRNVDRTIQG